QSPTVAQPRGLGLGVIIGEPTGISFKKWTNKNQAFDGAVAWSFGHQDAFHLHLDYLFHNRRLIIIDRNVIPFYYGIGGRFKFADSNTFGIRFPLGITVFIVEAPIDLFLEVVPVMNLAPETDLDLNAAIGARYYFR
ncbi:MAG: hypothetical protein HGA23_11530, partial [Bacteroidales bacterium]|nr:hypothetical protein [Bacteroidales bacterium]